eukprot:Blabericola_migrator_1__7962@NODE_4084_length_1340_cov_82_773763_g394_i1_p2_GENE_NODE_4084_length_1340_cov_82_773763_g394_i1NODE_4084_length_1340_cov_82_773763_g394_i1_p2_ORF_typecomplete_len168_score15_30Thioredoxin/PF00085_20/9_1e05AhpCTSA/PF00578_21/0_031OST3_OST6/PF04756_13/0_15Thioredoxin_3/PF13192_6/0_4DUF4866/PF16160_5/0_19Thioredoxin_2/PF13098_6/1_3_NODE_4084_length_1340_cov_82_773763_g394_i17541257
MRLWYGIYQHDQGGELLQILADIPNGEAGETSMMHHFSISNFWSMWLAALFLTLVSATVSRWNDTTIKAVEEKHDGLLLLFTIPENCPNCLTYVERFKATSDELETWLKNNLNTTSIGLGVMDLRESEATANDLQIEGAPSIVLVKGNYIHEYGGPLAVSLGRREDV